MTVHQRCGECGSWDAECASETAQPDCACARCASARVRVLEAEVERLREALRDVAERQREACAEYLRHWTYDEHALSRVRATPLVTEAFARGSAERNENE